MMPDQALERTRGSKVLSIQDYDRIQPIDRGGWAQVDAPVTDYDRAYPERLWESLGLELALVRVRKNITSCTLNLGADSTEGKSCSSIVDTRREIGYRERPSLRQAP